MVRPSRRGRPRPLLASEVSTGVVDGDDIDWSTSTVSDGDLIVEEGDGTPSVAGVSRLIFDETAFSVTDNTDGSVTVASLGTTSDAELNIEGGQSVIKAHGSMGSTETIDPTDGNVHTGTLDANVTYTLNAPAGSGACEIEFQRTGSGGPWTETWPGSVTWASGSAPTPPTTGNTTIVILRTLDGGTAWIGFAVGGSAAASFATPAIVLGTAAAAGAASTVIRSDATIVAFDATVPVTQAFSDTAATGSAAVAARRDHKHGMPASSGGGQHILLADGHSTPFTFNDLLQMDDGSDFMWSDS